MFKGKFDCRMEVIHKVFHRLELFGSAQKDQEDIVCESPPDVDGPNEGLLDSFFVATHERLAYGVSMAAPTSWRKCLSMNEKLLFFRMISSSIPIVWGLWATGGRVLVCNFM